MTLRIAAAAAVGAALAALGFSVFAQLDGQFTEAQVRQGAGIYAQNCSPCHGPRMLDPQAAFDLRTFPRDQKERFFLSVRKGKNQMPPWGDLFKQDEIEALWAYVLTGEK